MEVKVGGMQLVGVVKVCLGSISWEVLNSLLTFAFTFAFVIFFELSSLDI